MQAENKESTKQHCACVLLPLWNSGRQCGTTFLCLFLLIWNAERQFWTSIVLVFFWITEFWRTLVNQHCPRLLLQYNLLEDNSGPALTLSSFTGGQCFPSVVLVFLRFFCLLAIPLETFGLFVFETTVLLLFYVPLCAYLSHVVYSGILHAF